MKEKIKKIVKEQPLLYSIAKKIRGEVKNMSEKEKYKIDVSLKDDQMHIEISELNEPWFIRGYYLYKDGNLLKKVVKDNLDANFDFTLKEDGIYFIKVYIKNGEEMQSTNSLPISYFSKETKEKFEKFLEEKPNKKLKEKVDIYPLRPPFQDFAIVLSKEKIEEKKLMKKLPKNFLFERQEAKQGDCFIITSEPIINKEDDKIIFSGFGKIGKEIIIGSKEANNIANPIELIESMGNFTFAVQQKDKFIIGKDYFGTSSVFYYNTSEYTIVSNEYHLLLTIMNYLKVKMELDEDVAIANLCFQSGQLFEQHLSKRMEVKGVFQLPTEKYIVIENGKMDLKDTSIVELLDKEFKNEEYESLLKKAADEIMDNIKTVYASNKFKNIMVDVTGGTDSRIVFAAVTNINDTEHKIIIHTADDKRTNDLSVAVPLNNLYEFPYDTIPETIEVNGWEEGHNILRSLNIGTYYYIARYIGRRDAKNTVRFMGGGGEAIARPYYSKYLLHDEMGNMKDSKEFVTEFIRRRADKSLLGKEELQKCVNIYGEEIDNTIGEGVLEKFENTYMMLRSGAHLNHRGNQTEGFIEFFPVYSKTLFYLKMKTFYLFRSTKLAFDLIQYLNPILSTIPYEKKENNEEYKRIKDTLLNQEPRLKNIKITLNKNEEKWRKANEEKEKVTKYKGNKKITCSQEKRYEELIDAFQYVMKNVTPSFREAVGEPIYHWIMLNKENNTNVTVLHNKIYSLLDQINLMNIE